MGSVKTISIIVAANIKGLETGLGKANKSIGKFASNAARMGSILSFGVTAPLTALGKSAFDTFAQFENGMTKVMAVTGASAEEMKLLTDEAKRLGATTQFTASQVADLQLVLGRKGFDPTAIINMEASILDLALATGENLSLAAETVATSINAFNLEAHEASRVANTLASAAANSSIQLSTFATAFGHAGASANAVGVDLEELSAMMGVLMDNGIKASKAGTGLRKIFMKLSKDGTDFTEVLDLATQGQIGLKKAMKLAGVTAANQLLILANNKDKVAELTKEYKTNKTRLSEMAKLMGGTATAKVKVMQSAIEGLKIEFGAVLADYLFPIIDSVKDLANKFTKLDKKTKNLIITFGGIMTVVGPVLLGLGALLSLVNPLALAVVGLAAAFTSLSVASKDNKTDIEKENDALNNLARRLMSAKKGSEERLKLVKELQKKYPDFIDNIDAEATSNEAVRKALNESNKELLKKLRLQAESEKLQELQNDKTQAAENYITQENKALELSEKLNKKYGGQLDDSLSAEEQLNKLKNDRVSISRDESILTGQVTEKFSLYNKEFSNFDNTTLGSTSALLQDQKTELDKTIKAFDDYIAQLEKVGSGVLDPPDPVDPNSTELPTVDLVYEPTLFEKFSAGLSKLSEGIMNIKEEWGVAFNQMGQITSQFFANQAAENENWYNKQKATIEQSEMDEEQKAEAIAELDEEMAKKSAELKAKQAKAEKAAAMANAIWNTAEQVTKVIANPVKAAIVAGLGAVQIAAIAAQPIPAFADGGRPPVGKTSLVGERGPELFVPDQAGTIIPNHELGGGGTFIPDVRISGDDLLIVFDRAERRKNRR